jgi:RNA polymerase sigma factor (sigma-70 family)
VTLARVFARSWRKVAFDDFVGAGHEAVVGAARRFDPEHGVPFETFAYRPVWGAMMDLAHRETFVVQATLRRMSALALEEPADVALDDWLGASAASPRDEAIAGLRRRAAALAVAATAGPTPPITPEEAVIEAHERRRVLAALESALVGLPQGEREVVRAIYVDAETLDSVAERLGVAKRTVQRIHDRAKDQLARALSNGAGEPR